ncbi:MAG: hypothetical protein ACR2RV_08985 [Verrucomicrobiales bacterium]
MAPIPLLDPGGGASSPVHDHEAEDEEVCRRNLHRIGDAIQSYRIKSDGAFPDDLGHLLGEYLSDSDVFLCPVAKRVGEFGVKGENLRDPKGESISSYTWELSPITEFPLDDGEKISSRDFKMLQMQTAVGAKVPILRCDRHPDKWLNLTALGEVYESGQMWESMWVDRVALPYLIPAAVNQSTRPLSERLRPRPPSATARMLDLRPWCNARLEDPWIGWRDGEELTEFVEGLEGDGLFLHDGVSFDPAGLIQLGGTPSEKHHDVPHYPTSVPPVTIGQKFSQMHLLCGLAFASPEGSVVAKLHLHHRAVDGRTPAVTTIPWRYGIDVANLGFPMDGDPELSSSASSVAWTGFCELSRRFDLKARIFHLVVENPLPEIEVESFDFEGGLEQSAPFILAVTLAP